MKIIAGMTVASDYRLAKRIQSSGLDIGSPVATNLDEFDHLGVITEFLVGVDQNTVQKFFRVVCRVSESDHLFWLSDLTYCPTPEEQKARMNECRAMMGLYEVD